MSSCSMQVDISNEPKCIEDANASFIANYLGYFFVALSITSVEVLMYIYGIIFIFTSLTQTIYYNPVYLLMGYKFYYVTSADEKKLFIISKRVFNVPRELVGLTFYKITNFTYIEL